MKKGKREGRTELAHKLSPDLAADRLLFENTNRHIMKTQIRVGRNNDFIFINIHLNVNKLPLLIYIKI